MDKTFKNRVIEDRKQIFDLYKTVIPVKDSLTIDSILGFHKLINQLVNFEKSKKKIQGNVSLGFSGQESFYNDATNNLTSQYNVSSGIEFTVGSYPGELKVKSKIDVIVNNSELTTNLSSQEISYDSYVFDRIQGFVYVGRFADRFLSLESRYEAGAGFRRGPGRDC